MKISAATSMNIKVTYSVNHSLLFRSLLCNYQLLIALIDIGKYYYTLLIISHGFYISNYKFLTPSVSVRAYLQHPENLSRLPATYERTYNSVLMVCANLTEGSH